MGIYVCSDIHGNSEAFFKLLEVINFGREDTLYIIGDVMEYNKQSLDIIDFIRSNKNIVLLKGNQEDIFINEINKIIELDYFIHNKDEIGLDNLIDILARRGRDYAIELRDYFINLPFMEVIDNFILVHGDLQLPEDYSALELKDILSIQEEHNCIYGREFVKSDKIIEGYTVILGHTITLTLDRSNKGILYKPGKILIDCGAAIDRRLAALRLDDMKEFYIEIQ